MRAELTETDRSSSKDGDLSDLLEELRILLPGTQTLTAFLIILPFNGGFSEIREDEKLIYVVTFLCAVAALVLFLAPAAHHRLERPLRDREAFKNRATRFIIAGLFPLSVSLVLATELVLSTVIGGGWVAWTVSSLLGALILALWWLLPLWLRARGPG